MEKKKFASSTVSRSVASIRAFFQYLYREGMIDKDVSGELKSPKVEKKTPEILSVEEVDMLLEQPDIRTPKGMRDRAMLELLYATGMRVSELIHLKLEDLNLTLEYVTCSDGDRERSIPFGSVCRKALSRYLDSAREALLQGKESVYLFTNCSGGAMSRQGFWKLLKGYASSAGITGDITPHSAPFICGSYAAERSGYQECTGDAGTFLYFHDADLSESEHEQNAGCIYQGASAKIIQLIVKTEKG